MPMSVNLDALYKEEVESVNYPRRIKEILAESKFLIGKTFSLNLGGVAYTVHATRNSISFLINESGNGMQVILTRKLFLYKTTFSWIRNDGTPVGAPFESLVDNSLPDHYVRVWYILLCTDFLDYNRSSTDLAYFR
jgi:hypothetical protein